MIETFNQWFRDNMLNLDGRVVLWEHMVAWIPMPTAIGLLLTARMQSPFPLIVGMVFGVLGGFYSHSQDLIATRMGKISTEGSRRVPHTVGIVATAFLVLLIHDMIAISQGR